MLRLKAKELSSDSEFKAIYKVVQQLKTSPRCIYESENSFGSASTSRHGGEDRRIPSFCVEGPETSWLPVKPHLKHGGNSHAIWAASHMNPRIYGQPNGARRTVDVAVIPGGLTSVLQPLDKCINKPFKAKLRMLHETWMVNNPFTYTPSGKKRAPSKELMLTWINHAWNGIPQDLTEKLFKSCGIA